MIPPRTRDEFLALWRSLFPSSYTSPIDRSADGLDTFAAIAAIFARIDKAINSTQQRAFIRPHSQQTGEPATGGVRSTGYVIVTNGVVTPLNLVAGSVLRQVYLDSYGVERLGDAYLVNATTLIPMGQSAVVLVTCDRTGEHGNVASGSITAFETFGGGVTFDAPVVSAGDLTLVTITSEEDRFSVDMLGRYVRFVGGPNDGAIRQLVALSTANGAFVDSALVAGAGTSAELLEMSELGVTVTQPEAFVDGRDPWLDQLGADRKVYRQFGEGDDAYAVRIQTLDDTVSPNAILRATQRILSPLGIDFRILEALDPDGLGGAASDVTPSDIDHQDAAGYPNDAFSYSLICGSRRFFLIEVEASGVGEFGNASDDLPEPPEVPEPNASDYAVPDGYPVTYIETIAALWAQINSIREFGVCFQIERVPASVVPSEMRIIEDGDRRITEGGDVRVTE